MQIKFQGTFVAMIPNPFSVLEKTVNVLVVDDEPVILTMLERVLSEFGIYSVQIAESTKKALETIEQFPKRFHACLFDLGVNDVERNEFHLLDRFGKTIPFIIISATADTEKSFECKNRGAKAFVKKASEMFNTRLVSSLNKYALINMIYPGYEKDDENVLSRSVDALETSSPLNVRDWAKEVDIFEVKLRKESKGQMTLKPKQALCVFHVFSGLFRHIENSFNEKDLIKNFDSNKSGEALLDSIAYKKVFEYYLANRVEIDPRIFGRLPLAPMD